jgi:twitching motility protein PilI
MAVMSNKQSIQSLQERLAKRMQTSALDSQSQSPRWLGVIAAGRGYLFPLAHSGEIYPWTEIQKVPYSKDWFLGVANLRGSLCGVASLSVYLQQENQLDSHRQLGTENPAASHDAPMDKRLIAFHPAFEINTVLAVDQLAGLKSIDQLQATGKEGFFVDAKQSLWRQIDLASLAQNPAFMNIQHLLKLTL